MNKILMMTDEEIENMQEQMKEEKDTLPPEMQGPMGMQQAQAEQDQQQQQQQQPAEQAEPQDNTIDNSDETESLTPQLDDEVNRSVVSINNRRR
jgi:Skp family chaperone for outer membrane proteins